MSEPKSFRELFENLPKNWGRFGADDQIGALNFLTSAEVLRGVRAVRSGKVFTLGAPIGRPGGDPIAPGRGQPKKLMDADKGFYLNGTRQPFPGGLEYSDDVIFMYLQGTTQFDALGHVWYDDQLYNGYDARTTIGSLQKCSVQPMAEHGIVGRGVLVDVARYRGVDHLEPGTHVTLDELLRAAEAQGARIEQHDILVIRTGWLQVFYTQGAERFFPGGGLNEPGLSDEPALIEWFHRMEIPVLATDTVGNECTLSPVSGTFIPLHAALLRNLGVAFNEINWLEDLARDCASDRQYDFLYVGAPLKIVGGAGSPVNPIVVK